MKRYEFIRMKHNILQGGYVTSKKDGCRDHRTVIREMAAQGWRFVSNLPIKADGYGRVNEYDLVFEIDCEK